MNRKLAAILTAAVVSVGGVGAFVGQAMAAPQSAYPKPVREYVAHPKGFNDSADVKYGGSKISCPGIKTAKATYKNQSANVRSDLAPLVAELMRITEEKHGYKIKSIGGYSCRFVTNGSTPSNHAYARAIDINPAQNPYGPNFKSDMPPGMVADWMKYGFYWGGHYKSNKDAMHFEYIEDRAKIEKFVAQAKKDGKKAEPTKTPTKSPSPTKTPTKSPSPTKTPTKSPTKTTSPTKTPTMIPCLVAYDGKPADPVKPDAKLPKSGTCPPPPCVTRRPPTKPVLTPYPGQADPQIARLCPTTTPTTTATRTQTPTKPPNTPRQTPTLDPVPPTNDPAPSTDPVPPTVPVEDPPVDDGSDQTPVDDGSDQAPVDDGPDQAPADAKDNKDAKESTGGLASTGS